MARRARSAMAAVAMGSRPGSTSANSSPPYRATVSPISVTPTSTSLTRRSTSSPVRCPCVSFSDLKRSRSTRMKPRVVPWALARPSSLFRAVSNWRRLAKRVRSSVTASSSTSWRSQALRRARDACAASCSRVAMTLRSTRLLAVRPNTPISTPAGSPSVNSGKMATPAASGSHCASSGSRSGSISRRSRVWRRVHDSAITVSEPISTGSPGCTSALPVTARIESVPARCDITMQLDRPPMWVARWARTSARSPAWRAWSSAMAKSWRASTSERRRRSSRSLTALKVAVPAPIRSTDTPKASVRLASPNSAPRVCWRAKRRIRCQAATFRPVR